MGLLTEDKPNLFLFLANTIFAIILIIGTGIVIGTGSAITNPQYDWVVFVCYGDSALAIITGFLVLIGSAKKLSFLLCISTFLNITVIIFCCAIFWALYQILDYLNVEPQQYDGYRAMLAGAVVVACAQVIFICTVCVRCNAVRKEK